MVRVDVHEAEGVGGEGDAREGDETREATRRGARRGSEDENGARTSDRRLTMRARTTDDGRARREMQMMTRT